MTTMPIQSLRNWTIASLALIACAPMALAAAPAAGEGPVVKSEFVYEKAPFPSCHASTIAVGKDGLVAAWFGGTREGAKDVGVWVARHDGAKWSAPVEVATGDPAGAGAADGDERQPCWNPVLFQAPGDAGPLLLFYKVGPSPRAWWGMLITSA